MENETQMTPEEAKASLGLSTRLSEQFLMQQMAQEQAMMGGEMGSMPTEAPQDGKTPQGEEKTIRDEYPAQEATDDKLDMVLDEIASIKEEINKVLEEDNDKEDGQEK